MGNENSLKKIDSLKKEKKKGNIFGKLLLILIFAAGLGMVLYPTVSEWFYANKFNNLIDEYDDKVEHTSETEIDREIARAQDYNRFLSKAVSNSGANFLASGKNFFKGEFVTNAYPEFLKGKGIICYLTIPSLDQKLPVRTGADESVLQESIGYLPNTSIPVGGESTHSVLTGHRGLGKARLFRNIDKLKKGDKFYIKILNMKNAYEVDQIKVIEPTDIEDLKIESGKDYVTLLSCHPYSVNSHRIIVRGHRVPYIEDDSIDSVQKPETSFKIIIIILLYIGVIFIAIMIKMRKDRNVEKKSLKKLH